jgi:polysaccharide pyruvyl transferase CsaB
LYSSICQGFFMKLVVCGNYGATNIGDEAILDGILALIERVDPQADITVLSSDPVGTTALHNVKSANLLPAGARSFINGLFRGRMVKTFKVIKECDGFILGGGGLLTDEKMMAMVIWPLQAAFAAILKKPLFCLGQSVGPLRTFFGRKLARSVYKRALLATVRDGNSQQVLHKLGLGKPPVLTDPAFVIHGGEPSVAGRENLVVLSFRNWPKGWPISLYNLFAHFIDWIWQEYGFKSVLVPFSTAPENDLNVLSNIFVHIKHKTATEIFEYTSDYRKVMELISRAKAVVGMRLHSMIFATLTRTPFLALSYSDKVKSMAHELQMGDYTYDWGAIGLDDLKTGFRRLMDNYDKVNLRLGEQNLLMRAKAHGHEQILRTFFDYIKASHR